MADEDSAATTTGAPDPRPPVNGNGEDGGTAPKEKLGLVATAVAVALLVVYVSFFIALWRDAHSTEKTYNRHSALFVSLEALGFTAAGALLGTTVQRQVTRKAEAQAKDHKKRADANERDAEKGRALHNLAKAKAKEIAAAERRPGALEGLQREAPPAAEGFQELVDLGDAYDRGA
jgi:uncharacterized membrane protein YsdA (DUF1294 family)